MRNRTEPENGLGDAENPAAPPFGTSATAVPVTKKVSSGVVTTLAPSLKTNRYSCGPAPNPLSVSSKVTPKA